MAIKKTIPLIVLVVATIAATTVILYAILSPRIPKEIQQQIEADLPNRLPMRSPGPFNPGLIEWIFSDEEYSYRVSGVREGRIVDTLDLDATPDEVVCVTVEVRYNFPEYRITIVYVAERRGRVWLVFELGQSKACQNP
ncbi:MAG: hypothetical protein MN733_31360 [Nitrososphaera sp.]|nr:hypothetical protein [Nitrososphaera sp.]